MKKITTLVITGILALTMGVTAFAASESPSAPAEPKQEIQLTESQKADLIEINEKIFELQKQKIAILVEAGVLTQERADAIIAQMKDQMDYEAKNGPFGAGGDNRPESQETDKQETK